MPLAGIRHVPGAPEVIRTQPVGRNTPNDQRFLSSCLSGFYARRSTDVPNRSLCTAERRTPRGNWAAHTRANNLTRLQDRLPDQVATR